MARIAPSTSVPARPTLKRVHTRQSRTEEVMEILRASIVSGQLAPGSMHSVATLADEVGLSRTPVREALIKLASRGMVRFERNRGVRILEMSTPDLEEIFELRRLLEVPAAVKGVARVTPADIRELRRIIAAQERAAGSGNERELWELDRAFHRKLLLIGGNRRLADYVDRLRDVVAVRSMVSARSARRAGGGALDHSAILDCLERRDADALAIAVLGHLEGARQMVLAPSGDGIMDAKR
jgi:DNA-binding GntR family transcriptional regulator